MRRFLAFSIAVVCGINGALAAEPESARVAPTEREITDYEREHWAFQPLADVAVPQVGAQGSEHPVDRFLQALQSERGIDPLPAVSRATLLRRVSFDLTGLPPTPQEVQTFLADSAPDAYEKVVDRLLASTAYGERWAQHWLDLARFAETDGFEFDAIRPHAWRYRDWVIDALNRDLPFDEFVRMQIAGDELSDSPQGAIATGFLLCGPDMPDLNLQEERRHQVLNEMTATVGAVFLGLQMGCAQCHDHKYDPISQYDFYRLRAYFESANLFRDHPIPSIDEAEARRAAEAVWTREDHDRAKRRRELEETARKRFREKNPDERPEFEQLMAELSNEERADYTAIHERLKSLPALPELPLGRVIKEGEPRAGHYYARGDFRQPGPEVPCDVPRVLRATRVDADHPPKSPRVALARWLTGREQPLAARVLVNRIWQWHFGAGLCAAPSDFGLTASEPIQRQLLDWLAQHFINAGGSLKRLHRLLVTSRFYQRASSVYDAGWSADEAAAAERIWQASAAQDPENEFLWRRRRVRLDGESLRDAMLAASDRLSDRRGGPGVRPPLAPEITATLLKDQWNVNGDDEDHRRRSIYLFVRRNLRFPLFDVFDRPDTNATCPARHESTTAPQSLALLNSQFTWECSQQLAALMLRSTETAPQQQIRELYLRAFSRAPTADETARAEEFLARQAKSLRQEPPAANGGRAPQDGLVQDTPGTFEAFTDLCTALFNANEFVYLD